MAGTNAEMVDALLARYVAGALPAPALMLVESHLELSGQNRPFVDGMLDLSGEALESEVAAPISDRDRALRDIFEAPAIRFGDDAIRLNRRSALFPSALRRFAGFDADDVPWRTKMPGFRTVDFGEHDGCEINLFWIRPGRPIPEHTHDGFEITLVIDGAFADMNGRYGRGDIAVADETIEHRPVAEQGRPCICLAVTDAPLRFTGSIGRRLSDILLG